MFVNASCLFRKRSWRVDIETSFKFITNYAPVTFSSDQPTMLMFNPSAPDRIAEEPKDRNKCIFISLGPGQSESSYTPIGCSQNNRVYSGRANKCHINIPEPLNYCWTVAWFFLQRTVQMWRSENILQYN